MSTNHTAALLVECLARLEAGRVSLDECVAAHPDVPELRVLLELACAIPNASEVDLDPSFRSRTRAALISTIAAEKEAVTKSPLRRLWRLMLDGWVQPPEQVRRRMGMPALVIVIIMALTTAAGGGAVYASQGAVPGDNLYQVKTTVEELQLMLAADDEAKAQTYLDLAAKRLAEVQQASEDGKDLAAGTAAQAFVQSLAQVDQYIVQAAVSGKDLSKLLDRLAKNLAHQQKALAKAEERAQKESKGAIQQAVLAVEMEIALASVTLSDTTPLTGTVPLTGTTPLTGTIPLTDTLPLTSTVPMTGTLPFTFTHAISGVQQLAIDPLIPGKSYNGLLAKLRAAQAAIERGQSSVAVRVLGAFLHELNAMEGSHHISDENYQALLADYSQLVGSLSGSPDTKKEHGKKNVPEETPAPTAVPTETATSGATPTTTPIAVPTVATPSAGRPMPGPAKPSNGNGGQQDGRPADNKGQQGGPKDDPVIQGPPGQSDQGQVPPGQRKKQ